MTDEDFMLLVAEQNPVVECRIMNPDYFYADPLDDDEPFGRSERAIAVSACKRCPIVAACFTFAIDNNIEHGVWGASIPAERSAYRAKRDRSLVARQSQAA